jgi:uncharacterized membrane protein
MNDRQQSHQMSNVNISKDERYLALAGGAALLLLGARAGGKAGILFLLAAAELLRKGLTGHSMLNQLLGVNSGMETNPHAVSVPHEQGIHVVQAITIQRPAHELYNFWRNIENLPHFMQHIKLVEVIDQNRSRWEAQGPAGITLSWESEIVNDVPNEVIAWRSLENSQLANAGSVRFEPAPGGRGTEVTLTLEYVPPAGQVGVAIASLMGVNPQQVINEELRNFRRLMETGEITTTDNQPHGPRHP